MRSQDLVNLLNEYRDELVANWQHLNPHSADYHFYGGQNALLTNLIGVLADG